MFMIGHPPTPGSRIAQFRKNIAPNKGCGRPGRLAGPAEGGRAGGGRAGGHDRGDLVGLPEPQLRAIPGYGPVIQADAGTTAGWRGNPPAPLP